MDPMEHIAKIKKSKKVFYAMPHALYAMGAADKAVSLKG